MKLKLGTRGSALALTQSGTVANALRAAGHDVEIVVIRTAGDRSSAPTFGAIGAQGVFVREIEQALLGGEIDVAVHSYKDLPTQSPEGLCIAAVPQRVDAADVLIIRPDAHDAAGTLDGAGSLAGGGGGGDTGGGGGSAGGSAGNIPVRRGARVGTSSVRRGAWIRAQRPDLAVTPLRGNVPTRIGRLRDGDYGAILLAAAGLDRLAAGGEAGASLDGLVAVRLDPKRFVPAPSQGALAVQCRRDGDVHAAVAHLDHAPSRWAVTVEREALALAEGGCDTAFGAYCTLEGGRFHAVALLEREERVLGAEISGTVIAGDEAADDETADDGAPDNEPADHETADDEAADLDAARREAQRLWAALDAGTPQ